MATLSYDLAIVGTAAIARALKTVESAYLQHNRRMMRATQAAVPGGMRRGATGKPSDVARGFNEIGRAARAADLKMGRDRIRIEAQTNRKIERERLAHAKRLAAAEARAARQAAGARQAYARRTVGVAGNSVKGSLRAVGGLAMGGLAIGGGMAVAGAISSEKQLRASTAALANQAFGTGGEKRSRQKIQSDIEGQARALGISSGLGRENVVGGMRNFVSIAGNVGAAEKMAPFMADVSNATDADIADVGKTAGQIFQNLATKIDVSKPEGMADALQQTQDIMKAMAGQAKVGSIEFSDLAQQMGKVMSATSGFDGKVSDLATTMGAVAQLAIAGGASSPEEAMTSIMRFRDDMVANAKRFEKQGVDVFTDKSKTKLRGPEQVIMDVLDKSGGDLTKVSQLFGIRSMKAFQPFQEASQAAGGGAAGLEAVRKMLGGVKGATMSDTEIKESAAFRRQQADRQFEQAMEKFKDSIGQELLPAVTRLVPEFVRLAPHLSKAAKLFGEFIEELANNPLKTIGKVIAAKLAIDIATAGIGNAAKNALVNVLSGVKLPGAPGGPGGVGGAGAGAPVLAVAAAAAGTALAIDQGDKLMTEIGSTHRASDLVGGFKGGEFSGKQLMKDFNPAMFTEKVLRTVIGGGSDVTKSLLEASNMGTATASKATGAQSQLEGGRTVAPPELPADWKTVPGAIKEALAAGKGGPNRGSTPSPVK
jgi:hypothetical protein